MDVSHILHLEIGCFRCALLAILAYLILTGRISLSGLLRRGDGPPQLPLERIQFLLVTVVVCSSYLTDVFYSAAGKMPDIANNWLYLFGGSSIIYLATKAWSMRSR